MTLTVRGKTPFSLTEYATPIQYHETVNYNMGLFAQDQWTIKRLTANYGVRVDFLNAQVDPQDIAAGPFTPARHYDGVSNVPNWKDISPRLGVGVRPVRQRQDGAQGQLRPLRGRRRLHGGPCGQPGDDGGASDDADVERHHRPTTRSKTATSGTRWRTARAVRSATRLSAPRSRRRRFTIPRSCRDGASGRQLGDAVQHPAAGGAARVGLRRLLAPLVRQPLRHEEHGGDQRQLYAVLHRRADGAVDHRACRCRTPAVSSAGTST